MTNVSSGMLNLNSLTHSHCTDKADTSSVVSVFTDAGIWTYNEQTINCIETRLKNTSDQWWHNYAAVHPDLRNPKHNPWACELKTGKPVTPVTANVHTSFWWFLYTSLQGVSIALSLIPHHCPNPFQVAPEASRIGCEGVSWPGVPPGVITGRTLEHQMLDRLVGAVAVRADGRVLALNTVKVSCY